MTFTDNCWSVRSNCPSVQIHNLILCSRVPVELFCAKKQWQLENKNEYAAPEDPFADQEGNKTSWNYFRGWFRESAASCKGGLIGEWQLDIRQRRQRLPANSNSIHIWLENRQWRPGNSIGKGFVCVGLSKSNPKPLSQMWYTQQLHCSRTRHKSRSKRKTVATEAMYRLLLTEMCHLKFHLVNILTMSM